MRVRIVLLLSLLAGLLVPAGPAAAATPTVRVTSTLDTVQPLEAVQGATSAHLRALRGEFESFQLIIGGPGGGALSGVDVVADPITGPDGATIPAANVTVYAETYTRIWTPSDQEGLDENPALPAYDRGWCQWFPDENDATCGIPTTQTIDQTPYNHTWKCGGQVAPVIDARHCLIPDALVPRTDPFTGQFRDNAFPFGVPAGENRAIWVEILVPPAATAGTYTGSVTVTADGREPLAVPVSLNVLSVRMPAFGSRPSLDLQGGVRATVSQYCAAFGCPADRAQLARAYSMFVRSALEHRLPLTTVAPFQPAAGDPRSAFDRWIAPYFTGDAAGATDALVRPPRIPGIRQRLVLLDHWAPRAEWANWANALDAAGSLGSLSYYCDEFMTSQASFNQYCAAPYSANAVPAWPAGAGTPGAMLIGSQAQFAQADTWGYAITDAADRLVPNMAYHLHRRGTANTRPSYDTGFLATPGREVWGYDSNNSLGAGEEWSIANAYNGYPVIGGVDQPATSERGIGFTSWSYRLAGHFYYEAMHRFDDAWNNCSTTPEACLYDYFGGHGDGTLFYPGTAARIGGTTSIPVESIRLKRYRDGSEDYTTLRLLETGCDGTCDARSRAELAAIVGAPEGDGGLMPRMWETSVGAERFETTRAQILDLFPQDPAGPGGGEEASADLGLTQTVLKAPAGPNFTFELRVTNHGPDPAGAMTLYEFLPDGVEYVSDGPATCTYMHDGPWWCGIDNLAVGQTHTVRFVVRPGAEGPFDHQATIEYDQLDPDRSNNNVSGTANSSVICDLRGTSGHDVLVGTPAAEVLCGHGGDDVLDGGRGNDLLFGGTGRDAATYRRSPDAMIVHLEFQRPTADAAWPRFDGAGHGRDQFASIERAVGSVHRDILQGRYTAGDLLKGGNGADTVYGYGGTDRLVGGDANDALYGGLGTDVLVGGNGSDLCRDTTDTRRSCER